MSDWRAVIGSPADLVTSREKTREGFIRLALEKTVKASVYVDEAKHLRNLLRPVESPLDLWRALESKRAALLTAAGLSDKACSHLAAEDGEQIFAEFANRCLIAAGRQFKDELVYRFLLTRGDTLGGAMRNIGGRIGRKTINRRLLGALRTGAIKFSVRPKLIEGGEELINVFEWETAKGARVLLHDRRVPLTKTNVDFVVLDGEFKSHDKMPADANRYLALGEMKAGFDPAGADEHWKTASHALGRIRDRFRKANAAPRLFFIGAAIVSAMAGEIYRGLEDGKLHSAANLLDDEQISMLCEWILSL